MLNKQDEKLLQELLKKYKQGIISGLYPGNNITFTPTVCRDKIISSTSSGIGGGIQSIQEGDNITIDNTDPLNPIVSTSSSLFPNGQEIVTESRDFRDSDLGKLLVVVGNDITLTMPDTIVFSEQLRTIGLKFLQGFTGCGYQPIHGFTTKALQLPSDGEFITLITGEYLGKSSVGSIADMQVNSDDGIVTLNKYLYDKSQNAIPLSGTEVGKPVTGTVVTQSDYNTIVSTQNAMNIGIGDDLNLVDNANQKSQVVFGKDSELMAFSAIEAVFDNNTGRSATLQLISDTSTANLILNIGSGVSDSRGFIGSRDFSPNITDLDYTQKIYVDTHIAFTTVPTSSTDTGIKGQMAVDATYLYICVDTDTWTRVALSW